MSDSSISAGIARWTPTQLDVDDTRLDEIVATTRQIVAAAQPRDLDQAQVACGYVARFLGWVSDSGGSIDEQCMTLAAVDAYLDDLRSTGRKKGSVDSIRSVLRRCSVEGEGLRRPAPGAEAKANDVESRISSYVPAPERVAGSIWSDIEERVGVAVRASRPTTPEAASLRLTVTALYAAWAHVAGDPVDQLFRHSSVEAFIEVGKSAWEQKTARTYASALRTVGRANRPEAWPVQPTASRRLALAPYTAADLGRIEAAIEALPLRRRRSHIEAAFLLGRDAGLVGLDAAHVTPDDVSGFENEVRVRGQRSRFVVVSDSVGDRLRQLADECATRGELYLMGGKTRRNERHGELWRHLSSQGTAVESRRLRLSWLVGLVDRPLPLRAMLDQAGLATPEGLAEALQWAKACDRTVVHRSLRGDV